MYHVVEAPVGSTLLTVTALTDSADGGSTPGGRVGNVDVLRAVAALMVLATHAYFLSGRVITVAAERWYDVVILIGPAGVWLFFAISGYVISKPFIDRLVAGRPLPQLSQYALRRVVRIFPLYWVALTAFIVIAGAGVLQGWHYPLHYALLQNLVPGREQALLTVAWTLSIEVLFYIAIPLLALALRRWRPHVTPEWLARAIVASWLASIGFMVAADLLGSGQDGAWARTLFPAVWQMFCPGLLLALAPHLTSASWRRWVVDLPGRRGAIVLAAVLLLGAALVSPLAPQRYGLHVFVLVIDSMRIPWAVGFGLVLAVAIRARPVRFGFALRLGVVSYGIYLLHPVVIAFLEREWVPMPHEGLGAYVVHVAVVAGLTIPIALLSWRFFEAPLVRWARSRGGRPAPSPTSEPAAPATVR